MEYLDIESVRSKYCDITVTAVPNKKKKDVNNGENNPICPKKNSQKEIPPHVEIIRIPLADKKEKQKAEQPNITQDVSAAYTSEYNQVLAKLQYTNLMQAQLQMITLTNVASTEPLPVFHINQSPISGIPCDPDGNIEDKYNDLLAIIAEMRGLIPGAMGLRMPKDRLLRNITHARILIRECLMVLDSGQ